MSVPSFHMHFKAATKTSPLQYIKSTRLHQARLLMARHGMTAAAASAEVGYESAKSRLNSRRFWLFIVTMQLLLFVRACANTPPGNLYKLSSARLGQDMDLGIPLAIVVDYGTVPDVVDRPQLVLRINQSQVRVDEVARWSEPLKDQIANVIAIDLAQQFRDVLDMAYAIMSGIKKKSPAMGPAMGRIFDAKNNQWCFISRKKAQPDPLLTLRLGGENGFGPAFRDRVSLVRRIEAWANRESGFPSCRVM